MARRYIKHMPPVQHMNGKLAPSSLVCHNQPDSSETENTFYYGYRYTKRPDISRYALRDKARNLSVHPYTDGEIATTATFATSVDLALQLLEDEQTHKKIARDFRRQRRYVRMYNYAIAEIVKNGGETPPQWE